VVAALDAIDWVTVGEHGGDRRSEHFKISNRDLDPPAGETVQQAIHTLREKRSDPMQARAYLSSTTTYSVDYYS